MARSHLSVLVFGCGALGFSAWAAAHLLICSPACLSTDEDPAYVLGCKMDRIDGTQEDLARYKGKVVVMVNVASECGCTPQYQGLEKLYKEKKDAGLVVLGFPANNFGSQEPGSNEQIAEFCTGKFGVTFPMFEKISVKGEDAHALYKKLAAQPKPIGGEPKWNFTKFVVNREGKVVARFDAQGKVARTGELEPELVKKIDELLGGSPKPEESKPGSSGGTTAGG